LLTSQFFSGKVDVYIPTTGGTPEVRFKWNDQGANLFYQITQIKHPSPREINPKVPNPVEQIVDRLRQAKAI
jgi:hypothetical protein